MIPSTAGGEFNFDSACTSPYVSAPSSPPRLGNYFFSAPTSPTRAATFYRDFTDHFPLSADTETDTDTGPSSTIPFNWEEKPGTPKSKHNTQYNYEHDDADFAFDFSRQLERPSLSADELFDGGKIKPLKPPPGFTETRNRNDSPKSPKNRLKEALSPLQKMKDFDPFAAAMEETRRENSNDQLEGTNQRGGEKTYNSSNSSIRGKGSRPLSPVNSKQSSFVNSNSTSTWYSKWKLKDLLLFRSASEGHKDKYAILKKNQNEDVRNSSFRSTDSGGSMSSRRGKGRVSAHEWHYTVNRAAAEEMRRKTFLPYKSGLLGCLGFNIPVVHELSKGFGSTVSRE